MPGFEIVGHEERQAVDEIFRENGGVLFAHGFPAQRKAGRYFVREFEAKVADRLGVKLCLAVTSGTSAQYVALKAMGVGPGDEVITQSFTFIATVEAIVMTGATPVVVDIDQTFNMDPVSLERAITKKTKCIVPVHMLGNPASMEAIRAIADKHKIPTLEDACEAMGATYKGNHAGNLGKAGFFSLDFGKTITTGEGGLIITNDSQYFKALIQVHDHGHDNDPAVPRALEIPQREGFNFRMSELQAAVGLAQLKKLDFILQSNRKNKAQLKEFLMGFTDVEFRKLNDPAGDLADTIIFTLPSAGLAEKVVASLKTFGLSTKNVPDALNWHFSGNWKHLWQKMVDPSQNSDDQRWSASAQLLARAVSLPVMVNWTESFINEHGKKLVSALKAAGVR